MPIKFKGKFRTFDGKLKGPQLDYRTLQPQFTLNWHLVHRPNAPLSARFQTDLVDDEDTADKKSDYLMVRRWSTTNTEGLCDTVMSGNLRVTGELVTEAGDAPPNSVHVDVGAELGRAAGEHIVRYRWEFLVKRQDSDEMVVKPVVFVAKTDETSRVFHTRSLGRIRRLTLVAIRSMRALLAEPNYTADVAIPKTIQTAVDMARHLILPDDVISSLQGIFNISIASVQATLVRAPTTTRPHHGAHDLRHGRAPRQ